MSLEEQYAKYPFTLDTFQKTAVKTIEEGSHCLVCAPTGSGKSMVAQHATDWGLRQKKRVIYTTPIKSLSNQAYASLAKQFGSRQVGIMTGDNQYNIGANVLIMTTEILRNFILDGKTKKHGGYDTSTETTEEKPVSEGDYWVMNVGEQVSSVVFDEVHYIQDPYRGCVWETCLSQMPSHIQMTMLSATIQNPDKLVKWLSSFHKKPVILCEHTIRAVPLAHCFYTNLNPTHQQLPDPILHSYKDCLKNVTEWDTPSIERYMKPITNNLDWFQIRSTAIQGCVSHLKRNDMLPALCFVLSRKRCETLCATWSVSLFEQEQSALIHKDWKRIVRNATRGNRETLKLIESLPQYKLLTESLQKGVAFHHSGLLPVLKECVEMLLKDGRIPCIFATETFAVGINSPTRTVVMTDIRKRTESGVRILEPHEYTQMGGRAGRRGLDTVGYVVSLPTSFAKSTSGISWHSMVHGSPVHIESTQVLPAIQVIQSLSSKGDQSFEMLLDTLGKRSMRSYEIQNETKDEVSSHFTLTEAEQSLWDQWSKINNKPAKTQGQRKKKQKKINEWNKLVDIATWESARIKMAENDKLKEATDIREDTKKELVYTLRARLDYLIEAGYIKQKAEGDPLFTLDTLGNNTRHIAHGVPLYIGYVMTQIADSFPSIETIDETYMLAIISIFRGEMIEDDKDAPSSIDRDILGEKMVRHINAATKVWDRVAMLHSCWEKNALSFDLVQPLMEMKTVDFAGLLAVTGWQEGTLQKTMSDLTSLCGEIQGLYGEMGRVPLYVLAGNAETMARSIMLTIPSLYLQQTLEQVSKEDLVELDVESEDSEDDMCGF